ncbi:ABC transporter permease [Secundilactobacillus kimchicus]|uniref:ABC transporter permease n=1 Tax=Secundilactobacillus kimchicus TaxID=528209 RepID=UPI001DD82DA6|nr:ABC transporter permease [Secundilactobacillus kimchicus]MBT9671218.1 ABC transporter permease [Secundilactobacillus kimchicus]
MSGLFQQFKFDFQREILRNKPFLFFTLLMPAGFYILFTKVMVEDQQQGVQFAAGYMCNMIVYSLVISAFFGLAALLQRDRHSGYVARLRQTPQQLGPYYLSVALCFILLTILSIGLMIALAIGVNHVNLSFSQGLSLVFISLFGQLPLLIVSVLISRVNREETLSVLSNLLTFPVAIVSGLWWPLTTLPHWLQEIGRLMPTYRLNQLLNDVVVSRSVSGYDWIIIIGWIGGATFFVAILNFTGRRWQSSVTQ